jgi:hypothetical protein
MIVPSSPWLASAAPRVRQVVLVLASLFVAHDAIYLARFGLGVDYGRAMTAQGHDPYWVPVSLVLASATLAIALAGLAALRRSRAQLATEADATAAGPSYVGELVSVWVRLLPTVAVLFVVQENVERIAFDGHIVGLEPLFGAGASLVLPVLAIATFVLAAVGALVRWRLWLLEARLTAAAARARFALPGDAVRPTAWAILAATIVRRWIVDRRDAGRAPPTRLGLTTTTA